MVYNSAMPPRRRTHAPIRTQPKPPAPRRRPAATAPYDPAAEIIRPKHLPLATGLSEKTILRHRHAGDFPAPLQLSTQAIGWRRADVDAWLRSRTHAAIGAAAPAAATSPGL